MLKGKLHILSDGKLAFYCPGCKRHHAVNVDPAQSPCWGFNGDFYKPTFTPSVRVEIGHYPDRSDWCHFFVHDGKIQYLSDCTHALAGQTIEMHNEEEGAEHNE